MLMVVMVDEEKIAVAIDCIVIRLRRLHRRQLPFPLRLDDMAIEIVREAIRHILDLDLIHLKIILRSPIIIAQV
jgi:hypothetical protein